MKENFPSIQEIPAIIQRFKSALVERNVSSLFIVVMSHGNSQEVQMVDGKLINLWTDLVYPFNNTNFQEFIGKPKIFIIQTCQSFTKSNHSFSLKAENGIIADVLVALPNTPGYTSKRNKNKLGSWFIFHLMHVLREKASSTEFTAMLRLVQRRLKTHTESALKAKNPPGSDSQVQNTQVSTWMPIIFKNFYFNIAHTETSVREPALPPVFN
jgi:hypothetical protein